MTISRGAEGRRERQSPLGLGVVIACLAAGAAFAASGCSHAAATPPTPAPTAPAKTGTAASATSAASSSAGDPSEVMTAAELASIPDPIPGKSESIPPPAAAPAPTPAPTPAPPATAPPAASAATAEPTIAGTAPPPATSAATWRVQIFASPDLSQADRVAKTASARLGVAYSIEFEGDVYKVRMGSFASEQEAQSLRERAVTEGYSGAFRVRSAMPVTGVTK